MREIVLDLETTGLYTDEGHRIIEVGAVELVDGKPTGREFQAYVNPEQELSDFIVELTGTTNEDLADKPLFAEIAQDFREFIGDDPIIITCRHSPDYTLDIAFLTKEFEEAGMPLLKDSQWVNVRKWSEAMYGTDEASLDNVSKHFGIDLSEREAEGHGALLDAKLLAEVYPKLVEEYIRFRNGARSTQKNQKKDAPKP